MALPSHHRPLILMVVFCLAALASCDDPPDDGTVNEDPGALIYHPEDPFPDLLSDVGLYPLAGDLNVVSSQAMPYAPQWPLWSSGSEKHRYVVVPEGQQIDNSVAGALDGSAWEFPVGTIFFKTFLFPDGQGTPTAMETRLLRRGEEEWEYVTYRWNPDGQDAVLLDMKQPVAASAFGPDGVAFEHQIPNRTACRKCHESSLQPVLGFTELQLNHTPPDHAWTELEAMADADLFTTAIPSIPAAVAHTDPGTEDILGYFTGNCVHCHNGSDGPSSSFDLRPDVALDNVIDHPTESSASAAGIRVVPGHPEQSVLFQGFSGETDNPEVKPMPPLGAEVPDRDAIERVRAWILGLASDP